MSLIYPLDRTASSPTNYIVGEVHDVPVADTKIIVPTYSPFFTNNLRIYDHISNVELVKDVDFKLGELHADATLHLGHEVYQLIILTNDSINAQIRINYQTVGGQYSYPVPAIKQLYEQVISRNDPVDWNRVVNKPTQYPPSLHTHWLSDIYGFQAVVDALERVRNAIVISDVPTIQALIEWVDQKMEMYPSTRFMAIPETYRVRGNEVLTSTLASKDLHDHDVYNWEIVHGTTEPSDFINLSGQVTLIADRGDIYVKTYGHLTEERTFTVKFTDDTGEVIAETKPITLFP